MAREYRRMYGALLLWALVPMPFTGLVLPPFWIAAAASGVVLCWRARPLRIPPPVQNLVAVVILAVVVAAGGLQVGPLRPLAHLLLLLTAVRALMVESRRSFIRALPALALLWVAAVASSIDVTLVAYLAVSVALLWWVGMRVFLTGLAEQGRRPVATLGPYPRPLHAVVASAFVLVLAVPVFLAMPRLRSPWVAAAGGLRGASGFSLAVDLAKVGDIQESRKLAMVVRSAEGEPLDPGWSRLRATALDLVGRGEWRPRDQERRPPERRGGLAWTQDERRNLAGATELVIEVMRPPTYLFQPEGTLAVYCPAAVDLDSTGGVVLRREERQALQYRVWVGRGALPRRDPPRRADTSVPWPDPRVRELARRITAGSERPLAQAEAIESHLRSSYVYSLEGPGMLASDPVAWFLFEGRAGHCEFFAGSMVVLLRTLGVPARLVGGYSGGSLAPGGRELYVREENAHTWVEAWLGPELGWRTFDPTPSEGVPGLNRVALVDRLRLAWERVQIVWDRYVLTFGMGEQLGLVSALADLASRLKRSLSWQHGLGLAAAVLLVLLARRAVPAVWGRARVRQRAWQGPAAVVVARLARRLEATGTPVPPWATVRWIGRAAAGRWPAAAATARELVVLAEAELYGPAGKGETARAARRLWIALRKAVAVRSAG